MATQDLKTKLVIEAATKGQESIRQMIDQLKSAGVETEAFEKAADSLSAELDSVNRRMQQSGTQDGALGKETDDLARDMLEAAKNGERLSNELRKAAQAAGQNAAAAEKDTENCFSLSSLSMFLPVLTALASCEVLLKLGELEYS